MQRMVAVQYTKLTTHQTLQLEVTSVASCGHVLFYFPSEFIFVFHFIFYTYFIFVPQLFFEEQLKKHSAACDLIHKNLDAQDKILK